MWMLLLLLSSVPPGSAARFPWTPLGPWQGAAFSYGEERTLGRTRPDRAPFIICCLMCMCSISNPIDWVTSWKQLDAGFLQTSILLLAVSQTWPGTCVRRKKPPDLDPTYVSKNLSDLSYGPVHHPKLMAFSHQSTGHSRGVNNVTPNCLALAWRVPNLEESGWF